MTTAPVPSIQNTPSSPRRGQGEVKIIRCACDNNHCPAQLEMAPVGKFMNIKSGNITVALDMQRALEMIGILSRHFRLNIHLHVRANHVEDPARGNLPAPKQGDPHANHP